MQANSDLNELAYMNYEAIIEFLDDKVNSVDNDDFLNSNVIQANFKQGILATEGSFCKIIGNKIDSNIKANIALGGKRTGQS